MSYNEDQRKNMQIRHLFFPNLVTFFGELVLAVITLVVINLSTLGDKFFVNSVDNSDPLAFTGDILNQLLAKISQYYAFQQISLFLLWAIVGILVYLLVFWLIHIVFGVSYSLKDGVRYYKAEKSHGLIRWLSSLHDFFLKLLLYVSALILFSFGVFVCFAFASYELQVGLMALFPNYITPVLLSILGAILGTRLTLISICLAFPRIRKWYST